jgi:hypothetical protein
VKPEVVERNTRYSSTPTLSVAAVQVSFAPSVRAAAVRLAGAVGAAVSPLASTRTIWPCDGTPFLSTRNTMYQPGGATFAFDGPLIVRPSVDGELLSGMKRWSMSRLCVTVPMRTSDTEAILDASGVSTPKLCP